MTATLASVWRDPASAAPSSPALDGPAGSLSYGELGAAIEAVARVVARRWGPEPGAPVALLAPNVPEFVVSYFGIVGAGRVVQPLDGRLSAAAMEAVVRDSGARHLVAHAFLADRAAALVDAVPALEHVALWGHSRRHGAGRFESADAWLEEGAAGGGEPGPTVAPDDVAELMYTSGTTGEPKGVLRTHRNVLAAARNAVRGFGYGPDDRILIAMPLSHSSALNSQMVPMIGLGARLVLQPAFEPEAFVTALGRHGITCFRAVPAMLRMLLAHPAFRAGGAPGLRRIISSSAPLDTDTLRALADRFPGIEVANSYGLTEASTCTILHGDDAAARPDSVGVPIEGVEMSVLAEDGTALGPEEEGELAVRGDHVFAGYLGRPEATAAVLRDGLLRTGDLGHRDDRGFYYVHGRRDDVIRCGGMRVVPEEVERWIVELPDVLEAAVVRWPHRVLGEVGKAFVVARPGVALTKADVTRHCARRFASHQVPFHVEFVAGIPRNGVGKVLRRQLEAGAA